MLNIIHSIYVFSVIMANIVHWPTCGCEMANIIYHIGDRGI